MSEFDIKDFIISDKNLPNLKLFKDELNSDINHIYPFDCSPIDITYGGGIAAGRIYECFAWESTGKSTLALEICRNFSKYWSAKNTPHIIVWQEAESTFDRPRAAYMDLPIKKFIISETETLEQMGNVIKAYCTKSEQTGIKVLHVVDTTAALQTENELNPKQKKKSDGSLEDNQFSGGMMEKPRVFRQVLRDIVRPLAKTDSTLIMCNQIYKSMKAFQEDQPPGGGGPKFYCSVRTKLAVNKMEIIKHPDGTEQVIGIRINLKHIKNKITLPKQEVEVIINGETGINKFLTLFTYLSDHNLLRMAGPWKYLTLPVKYGDPQSEPEMKEVKFLSANLLKEIIETEYPQGKDWMDYLVYRTHLPISPLLKVRLAPKIWNLEERFFGKRLTILSEDELRAAEYTALKDE